MKCIRTKYSNEKHLWGHPSICSCFCSHHLCYRFFSCQTKISKLNCFMICTQYQVFCIKGVSLEIRMNLKKFHSNAVGSTCRKYFSAMHLSIQQVLLSQLRTSKLDSVTQFIFVLAIILLDKFETILNLSGW